MGEIVFFVILKKIKDNMQTDFKNNRGVLIIAVLALIPFFIWIFLMPLSLRFGNPSNALRSLGQIAGLTGIALFSANLILSARLKIFEDYFGGINRAYIVHHFIGGLAFCFLLFHPILLASRFLSSSFYAAVFFFIPSTANMPVLFGTIGLTIMIIALFITFYLKIPYQNWKLTHKLLGIAFIFAYLHVFFIPSDVSSSVVLRVYIMTLGLIAIIAYFYRAVLGKFLVKRHSYTIKAIEQMGDAVNITLSANGNAIKYSPGQFIFISFIAEGINREVHPFSISSASPDKITITVKSLGDFTNTLKNLKAGAKAKIEGPYGRFTYSNFENKNQIWIAGGIGITPFLSMARSMAQKSGDYNILFYYSVKNEAEFLFKDELIKIGESCKNIKIIFWVADKSGFLTAEEITKNTSDIKAKDIFVCGPPMMMKSLRTQFVELGVENNRIHSEEFALL